MIVHLAYKVVQPYIHHCASLHIGQYIHSYGIAYRCGPLLHSHKVNNFMNEWIGSNWKKERFVQVIHFVTTLWKNR